MKKCRNKMLLCVVLAVMCFLCMNILADIPKNEEAYLESYQSILNTMKAEMENAEKTGDPALNYLYQMRPHHEAAIAMSKNLIQYGTNEKVKEIAQKIIEEQTGEITKVNQLIEKIKADMQEDKAQETAYRIDFMVFYDAMITSMESTKLTGDVDKDFLQQMIPHHDGAINISRSILKYTPNEEVKQMAQNTIKKQSDEIREMDQLFNYIH
ncbi:DUF305 domain-containing protein [Cellulosilyticum sp. I15G10I2]|uniref:DUF305 domain-containing protein n=1 Tax=Cellulosilyticum sp. I15G10I2 TaxID=1892843 RepID=UPI00085C91FA|nr:DUF305 domain-containing protein [Cellulosilyticum sp. I15G10I2]